METGGNGPPVGFASACFIARTPGPYRADDQQLVNAESFDAVWATATPVREEG